MLGHALRGLGRGGPEWDAARLIAEREMAIIALRRVCTDHGDSDWDDDLNLSDIIEKHLARYLDDKDAD
jgi:predicted secreted protein